MTRKKTLLILNDIFKIFYGFLRSFRLKNRTLQKTNQLGLFLTLFIMSVGIFRISLENQDFSITQNFYGLSKKRKTAIMQNFETFFFQSLKDSTRYQKQYDKRKKAKEEEYQKLSEKEKNFFDFYKYLEDRAQNYEGYEYPSTFKRISDKTKKKETVNLYRNFEQIDYILGAELRKEEQKIIDDFQSKENPFEMDVHFYIDLIPFFHWNNPKNDYNHEQFKKLLAWELDEHDVEIRDATRPDYLDKSYKVAQKVYPQYKNFVEKEVEHDNNNNENDQVNLILKKDGNIYKDLKQEKFPNPKIYKHYKSGRDKMKLFIQTKLKKLPYSSNLTNLIFFKYFENPITKELEKHFNKAKVKLQLIQKYENIKNDVKLLREGLKEFNKEQELLKKKTDIYPRKIPIPRPPYNLTRRIFSDEELIKKPPKLAAEAELTPGIRSIWKKTKLVSGYQASQGKLPMFYKDRSYAAQKKFNKQYQLSNSLKRLGKKAININFYPENATNSVEDVFLRSDWHQELIDRFKKKLPPKNPSKDTPHNLNRIQKVEDRIPLKIQGFNSNKKPEFSPGENLLRAYNNKNRPQKSQILSYRKTFITKFINEFLEIELRVPDNFMHFSKTFSKNKITSSILDIKYLKQTSHRKTKYNIALKKFLDLLVNEMELYEFESLIPTNYREDGYYNTRFIKKQTKKGEETIYLPRDLELNSTKAYRIQLKHKRMGLINFDPPFFFDDPFDFFIRFFDQYICLNLREHSAFQDWRETHPNKNRRLFDKFFGKFSSLLEKQNKNYYLNQILNSEDYLLEAIYNTFHPKLIEKQLDELIDFVEDLEEMEPKSEMEIEMEILKSKKNKQRTEFQFKTSLFNLFPKEIQNEKCLYQVGDEFYSPSEVTPFFLNFLAFRKNRRDEFIQHKSPLVATRYNFEQKKKMQIYYLYSFLLNESPEFCPPYLLEYLLKSLQTDSHQKKAKYNYLLGLNNQIPYYVLTITDLLYQKLLDQIHFYSNQIKEKEYFQKLLKQFTETRNEIEKYFYVKKKEQFQKLLEQFQKLLKQFIETRNKIKKYCSTETEIEFYDEVNEIYQKHLKERNEKFQKHLDESFPNIRTVTYILPEEHIENLKKIKTIDDLQNFTNLSRIEGLERLKRHEPIKIKEIKFEDKKTFSLDWFRWLKLQKNSSFYIHVQRKLPLIPEVIEFPYLILNNRNPKDKYYFRVENLKKFNEVMDPIIAKRKIKLVKQYYKLLSTIISDEFNFHDFINCLKNLEKNKDPENTEENFFYTLLSQKLGDQFMTLGDDENIDDSFYKVLYRKFRQSRQSRQWMEQFKEAKKNYNPYSYPPYPSLYDDANTEKNNKEKEDEDYYDETPKEREEREYFEKTDFKQVISDICGFLAKTKRFKLSKRSNFLPIYQNLSVRRMSGYLYPDVEKVKHIRRLSIMDIPIYSFNNENFIQLKNNETQKFKFIFLPFKPRYHDQTLKNLGLVFDRQFFELREYVNKYSLSLLFFFSSGWLFIHIFKNIHKKYAKEIVEACIDLLKHAGILYDVKWIKEELGMAPINKGYRGIRNHRKKLKNVIGLNYLILKICEMTWFLKTKKLLYINFDPFIHFCIFISKKTKKNESDIYTEVFPNYLKQKGFLLTGPPGTGKTLLVQAIAGESRVPVVTQSGGLLQNPKLRGKGANTIYKLFARAREISPCIIFIDELDGIGVRRQFLPTNIGSYDIIPFLESCDKALPPKIFQTKIKRREEFYDDLDPYWKEPEFTQIPQSFQIPIDVLQDIQSFYLAKKEQVSMLTQLLIELDGVKPLDNIIIISATNQFENLDPALLRPGRFQYILKFYLPNFTIRKNLFKFYIRSSKIGIKNISWDYFSKRTYSLTSATIAAIISVSELTAIQKSIEHTFTTLERGINLITSITSNELTFRLKSIFINLRKLNQIFFSKNNFYSLNSSSQTLTSNSIKLTKLDLNETAYILRNCYYNIGKMLIVFLLQPEELMNLDPYITFWERPRNFRFIFFIKHFNEFLEIEQKKISRIEIEKKFVILFGGKAGESLCIFLPLQKFLKKIVLNYFHPDFVLFKNNLEQSNFGLDGEIQIAQNLIKFMIEKWYFYSEKIATEKFHPIFETSNLIEYYLEKEKEIFLSQIFVDEMIIDLDMRNTLSQIEQKQSYQAWWMKKISTKLNYIENRYHWLVWSRIYLSNPQSSIQNIEWVSPDEYFHTVLRTPPYCMAWSHFMENRRFAIENLLFLQAFNAVFRALDQFYEFFDILADYLLRYENLTEKELQSKIYQFFLLLRKKIS
uniref:Cell division protein FTSH n=1 Tax=Udotea sp. TZ0819 TaxID=2364085 RepID=A0A386B236_9CHLO|nr:Cell division protein FTSH [Udotea sp. TZ0819]